MLVKIDKILISESRRPLRDIQFFAQSIQEIGLLNPILITDDYRLIAGYHRIEACKSLGWQEIEANIVSMSELDRELAEIDENLIRNELTELERDEHLLRRKEIHEIKYPEARAEEQRKKGLKQYRGEIISPRETFTTDTAAKTNLSPRTIQQGVQIARDIAPDVKDAIRDTPLADSKVELLKLSRMEPEQQRKVAEKISTDGEKTVSQVMREIKKAEVTQRLASLPSDKYRVVYADPPWFYGNSGSGIDQYGPAERHYPSMTIAELCALDIQSIIEDNAVLFIWVTSPLLAECWPVIKAWGFSYKTSFVWDKVKHNYGHYNSVRHELLLICTRGSCTPDITKLHDSVQVVERSKDHSEKPEEFRAIIDEIYPHGKRIELFARKRVDGWDNYGNEV